MDDNIPEERALGIQAGFLWGQNAGLVVIYTDLGITPGMKLEIQAARKRGAKIEFRKLKD